MIITVANRKGGVGKSTISYNLGVSYAMKGKKVLFVDLDSQANLTSLCRAEAVSLRDFIDCQIQTISDKIHVLPATKDTTGLETEINNAIDPNSYLSDILLDKVKGYDYTIIDTSPSLSRLNINAFFLSDRVHIVVNPDSFSLEGLTEMRAILDKVKRQNTKLDYHLVMNALTKGRKFSELAADKLREDPRYTIEIPHRQHIIDSNALKKPAIENEEIRDLFYKLAEVV